MATPLAIEIALHYQCRTGDYRDGDFSAPAVRQVIDNMVERGLLVSTGDAEHLTQYQPTEGLSTYVGALTDVPYPVQKWVVPADPSHEQFEGLTSDEIAQIINGERSVPKRPLSRSEVELAFPYWKSVDEWPN